MAAAQAELAELAKAAAARGSDDVAAILEAQALMLADPLLIEAVRRRIDVEGVTAEAALAATHSELAAAFAALDDLDLQARAADLADAVERVGRHLAGAPARALPDRPHVLVARDLTPSETAGLDPTRSLALVTEAGGPAGHTAIIARSLGLPAVVAVAGLLAAVADGDHLLVDGERGEVIVRPVAAEVAAAEVRRAASAARQADLIAAAQVPARTRDGRRVEVAANIDGVAATRLAFARGAEAIGLFRTEMLFLNRPTVPDEEEQYAIFAEVARLAGDRPVLVRTLDIGGDKRAPALDPPVEPNPFLGERGLRFCLRRPALFETHLRAILRASAAGRLAIMLPMVTSASEIAQARAIIERARVALRTEGHRLGEPVPLGIMIETPAAAVAADLLAALVDFVSVGSNDLTQYTLAADRTNPAVAALADPYHPAMVRLLAGVAAAARAAGIWAGVCGELAGAPAAIPLLVGLGYDELSMRPAAIPLAKAVIRDLDAGAARRLAEEALRQPDAAAVRALLGA